MTMPDERLDAIDRTRLFLVSLLNPEFTPGVSYYIRAEARSCLRHYPHFNYTDEWREREGIPLPNRKEYSISDTSNPEIYGYDVSLSKKYHEEMRNMRLAYYKSLRIKANEKEKKKARSSKRITASKKRKTKDSKKTQPKSRKK